MFRRPAILPALPGGRPKLREAVGLRWVLNVDSAIEQCIRRESVDNRRLTQLNKWSIWFCSAANSPFKI